MTSAALRKLLGEPRKLGPIQRTEWERRETRREARSTFGRLAMALKIQSRGGRVKSLQSFERGPV